MLGMEMPKSVSIIVKAGENLEYCVPGSKKTAKSRRWRVVFIGAKKKMATEEVEDQDGCPVWNSEVQLDLVNPSEPVVLLVLDGDKHHVGQVVIPLAQVPRTGPPNFDPQRLHYSELEETKKNSKPRGRLVYWMWATSYWPPGTKIGGKSKSIISLGSRSKLKRQSQTSAATSNGTLDDHHQPMPIFHSDGRSSPAAPSMISGAYSESNYSGHTSSYLGAAGVDSNHVPYIAPGGGHSYNPLSPYDEAGATGAAAKPPLYQSALHLGTSEYAESTVSGRSGKRGIRNRLRDKFSKSTQNLANLATKPIGSGIWRNPSEKGSQPSLTSIRDQPPFPDSTSGVLYRPTNTSGSITSLSRENYMPDGGLRPPTEERRSPLTPQPSVVKSKKDRLEIGQASTESWGMHAEERPGKPVDQMSHREVANYAMQLERTAQVTRSDLARLQSERDALAKRAETAEGDLHTVRSQLADLRFRLLNAGLTEYLELPNSPTYSGTHSVPLYQSGSVTHRPLTGGQNRKCISTFQMNDTGGSNTFLNKLGALTRKPVNGAGSGPTNLLDEPISMGTGQLTDWW